MTDKLGAKVAGFTVLGLVVLVAVAWTVLYLWSGDKTPRSAARRGCRHRRAVPGAGGVATALQRSPSAPRNRSSSATATAGRGASTRRRPGSRRRLRSLGRGGGWRLAARSPTDVGADHRWRGPPCRGLGRPVPDAGDAGRAGQGDRQASGGGHGRLPRREGRGRCSAGRAPSSPAAPPRQMLERTLPARWLAEGADRDASARGVRRGRATGDEDFGEPAMSAPVTLVLAGQRVVAPPRLFGKGLSVEAKDGELVPRVDGEVLLEALDPVMRTVGPGARERADRGTTRQAARSFPRRSASRSIPRRWRRGSRAPPYSRGRSDAWR